MKTTMNLLPFVLFVLLLGGIGCVPEATKVEAPEAIAPPVAEVVIKLVEDGSALALTLTNSGDVELVTTSYGFYRGYELILKDALGESLVHLAQERLRIPGTDEFHPADWHHFPVDIVPGQSIDAVLPLSAIFPFNSGQEYSLQATRWVRRRNDMELKSSVDEHGVVTGQGYDNHLITSNTLHFEAADGSR